MKKLILTLYILFTCTVLIADDKPIISLSSVMDYMASDNGDAALALRSQIATRLVRTYDCYILSRAANLSLARESRIKCMNAITEKRKSRGILASDHTIRLYIRKGTGKNNVRAFMIVQDFRADVDKKPDHYEWIVDTTFPPGKQGHKRDYSKYIETSVAKIGDVLSLKKRTDTSDIKNEELRSKNETWTVLPFARFDKSRSYPLADIERLKELASYWSGSHHRHIMTETMMPTIRKWYEIHYSRKSSHEKEFKKLKAQSERYQRLKKLWIEGKICEINPHAGEIGQTFTAVEKALQQSGNVEKIVDRSVIDSVLNELKINSTLGITENMGSTIAGMVNADKIIIGTEIKDKHDLQINMHLVDAETSVILYAAEKTITDEATKMDVAEQMALEIASAHHDKPKVTRSPEWQLKREALFYRIYWGTGGQGWAHYLPIFRRVWLDRITTTYLLMQDNPAFIFKYPARDASFLVSWATTASDARRTDLQTARSTADVLDHMLKDIEHSSSTPSPLLMRSTAHMFSWNFKEAEALVNEHKKKHPKLSIGWVKYIETFCAHAKGDYRTAGTLAGEAFKLMEKQGQLGPENYFPRSGTRINRTLANILLRSVRKQDVLDEDLEYEVLQSLYRTSKHLDMEMIRFMMLTRKRYGLEKAAHMFPIARSKGGDYDMAINFMKAEYLIELGEYAEAAKIYNHLFDLSIDYNRVNTHSGSRKYAKQKLMEIGNITGTQYVKPPPITLSPIEICKPPSKYKIYCIPVAGSDTNIIHSSSKIIKDKTGFEVIIKKTIPLPVGTFDVKARKHIFPEFSRQLLQNAQIPDDALFVYFVTKEPIIAYEQYMTSPVPCYPSKGNPVVCAYGGYENNVADRLAKTIVPAVLNCVSDPLPDDWLGWSRWIGWVTSNFGCGQVACQKNPYGFCGDCSAGYNQGNMHKTHKALHSFLKRDLKYLGYFQWHPNASYYGKEE